MIWNLVIPIYKAIISFLQEKHIGTAKKSEQEHRQLKQKTDGFLCISLSGIKIRENIRLGQCFWICITPTKYSAEHILLLLSQLNHMKMMALRQELSTRAVR